MDPSDPDAQRVTAPTAVADHDSHASGVVDADTLQSIDRWLAYRVWHTRVPGAQVAVGLGGQLLFSAAYGWADVESRRPMSPEHLFRIASHSKTFTATLILQLAERGRLRLDDRLGDHLPELSGHELGEVALRELLEHSAGVLRDGVNADFWLSSRAFPDRAELFALVGERGKRDPGELFAYSNLGYGLLGAVIEAVAGESYVEAARRGIVEPLELTDTFATYDEQRASDYAVGYSGLHAAPRRHTLDHIDTHALDPAAGFTSTARDLVAYFGAHRLGDSRLLDDRSKRLMQRRANVTDPAKPDGDSYGLGLARESVKDHHLVGHGGGYPGHITKTLLDPADGLVVSVLTNAIDGPAGELAAGVVRIIDDARAHPLQKPHDEAIRSRTGRWANVWGVVDLSLIGGRLLAVSPTGGDPLDSVDELELDDSGDLRIISGSGYGSVGEPVTFADDGSMQYAGLTFQRFDEPAERDDRLG